MDFKVLRGQRLINQLEELEEDSTYSQLYTGILRGFPATDKRQHATGPVHIRQVVYIPYLDNNALRCDAEVTSGPNKYSPAILFRQVEFQDENLSSNTTFRAADNNEYHIIPISLAGSNVRVRCNCLDFYYRFSPWNYSNGSLAGEPPPPYQDRDPNRGPANPTRTPGVCKHIIKLVDRLKQARIVT